MKTIGFLISHKDNEKRRAILPKEIENIKNRDKLFFEEGYGKCLGISDKEYVKAGANIEKRENIFEHDVICDVKLGDADYLDQIGQGKILFGWAHSIQNIDFTTKIIEKRATVIAWEEMFEENRYIFYKNRELAGEAGVLQAILYSGLMPYDAKIAILGNGQTAKGAMRVLTGLGAQVDVYGRKLEKLFIKKMDEYDILVNCVMWDTTRDDRIIYKDDLKRLKQGAMIIDISCDPNLEIETTHATTISNPVYIVDGIIHYAVDNTPSIFYRTTTKHISNAIYKYIDDLVEEKQNKILEDAIVIKNGKIIDKRIEKFRNKNGIQ